MAPPKSEIGRGLQPQRRWSTGRLLFHVIIWAAVVVLVLYWMELVAIV